MATDPRSRIVILFWSRARGECPRRAPRYLLDGTLEAEPGCVDRHTRLRIERFPGLQQDAQLATGVGARIPGTRIALLQHPLPVVLRRRAQPHGDAAPLEEPIRLAIGHDPAPGREDARIRLRKEPAEHLASQPPIIRLAVQGENG